MKNLYKIIGILGILILFSCEKADELVPTLGNEVTGIRIMLPDGTFDDFAVTPDEQGTIHTEIAGSINTDREKIRMSISIPNNAMVESAIPLGKYMDFTKPVSFNVIDTDGAKKTYTVKNKVIPNDVFTVSVIFPNGKQFDGVSQGTSNDDIFVEISKRYASELANVQIKAGVPGNAKIEPALESNYDFRESAQFSMVGEHGIKTTYTVKPKLVDNIITIKELWKKKGSEMAFSPHNNGAIGISGDYVVLHSRSGFSYFNISDGAKVGDMSWEGIDWQDLGFKLPLHMTTDDAGNIASCNAAVAGGQEVHMFWWKGVTAKPELLFKYTLENMPNAQLGRKIYVKGDLTKHAFIYLAVSNNNVILQWEVKDGKVVSETPTKINLNIDYTMGVQAKVVPVGLAEDSNYFINRFENGQPKVAITYIDGKTHKPIYESEHHIQGVFHQWLGGGHAFDYANMDGAGYFFLIEQNDWNWMREIFDVSMVIKDPTSIKDITELIHTRIWNAWTYFPLDPTLGKNGNATGEVKVRVAPDGNSCTVAFMCTNSGVIVWNVNLK